MKVYVCDSETLTVKAEIKGDDNKSIEAKFEECFDTEKTSINELQEGDFVYDVRQGNYAQVMHTTCKWYALIEKSAIPSLVQ